MKNDDWKDITTFDKVVAAIVDSSSHMTSEYLRCGEELSLYNHLLRYWTVRYAIDRGCRSRFRGRWYTPTLMFATELHNNLGEPVGMVTGHGEDYYVYPGDPERLDAQAISSGLSDKDVRFPVTYNQFAVTSKEKARHISRYFAKELYYAIYGELDYAWEEP